MLKTQRFALTVLLASAPAWADCTAPEQPELPDGANASLEEMLAGQKAVKAFQAENKDYRKCVEARIEAARNAGEAAETKEAAAVAEETYSAAVESYNAAVAAEEQVAGDFNLQLREYKAATQD